MEEVEEEEEEVMLEEEAEEELDDEVQEIVMDKVQEEAEEKVGIRGGGEREALEGEGRGVGRVGGGEGAENGEIDSNSRTQWVPQLYWAFLRPALSHFIHG